MSSIGQPSFILTVCWLILTGATSTTVANDFTSSCYTVNNHNYCFYTNGSVMSWNEARQFCAGMNSTLPIIRDEDIDKVFQKFIVNDSYNVIQNNYVWIGARARPVNELSPWHWINGRHSGFSSTRNNRHWNAVIHLMNDTDPKRDHLRPIQLLDSSWTENRSYICQYHSVTQVNKSCSPQWKELSFRGGYGNFVIHTAAKTLQECQQACLFNPRCGAVVWPNCYLFTNVSSIGRNWPGRWRGYELVKRCNVTAETSCDGGYVHKSTCYKIHTERVRWFTAVNRCLSNNASLAVFDDDYIVVTRNIIDTTGPLWVGLIKSWWTWPDDDNADVLYNKFNVDYNTESLPLYPDDNEYCAVARKDWKAVNCPGKQLVVCEGEPPKTTTTEATTTTAVTTTVIPDSTTSSVQNSDDGDNSAVIIGLSVGLVVLFVIVIIIVVGFVVVLKRRQSNSSRDHQSQHHRDDDEDDKPTVADADYTELHDIGADNAAHLYSELDTGNDNVPTHN